MSARFKCVDCAHDTMQNEYYMVTDEVWAQSGLDKRDGMLCIGCLEGRIGRELVPSDFPDFPINCVSFNHKSQRLLQRMGKVDGLAKIVLNSVWPTPAVTRLALYDPAAVQRVQEDAQKRLTQMLSR